MFFSFAGRPTRSCETISSPTHNFCRRLRPTHALSGFTKLHAEDPLSAACFFSTTNNAVFHLRRPSAEQLPPPNAPRAHGARGLEGVHYRGGEEDVRISDRCNLSRAMLMCIWQHRDGWSDSFMFYVGVPVQYWCIRPYECFFFPGRWASTPGLLEAIW